MEMFAFKTENSYYAVDCGASEVSRLSGVNDPTPRQGEDGEWKHVEKMTAPIPGSPVIFDWDGEGHCTITSPVRAAMLIDTDEGTIDAWWLDAEGESCFATFVI